MSELSINILGFPAVNRDLQVELRDPTTNALVREVKPFADGTLQVSKLAAGAYEMVVKHPNMVLPVIRRPLRVLPDGPTRVSVLIDPSVFRHTAIEDIPDADLTPVRQAADSIAETLLPLASKRPGEAIRAEDWNQMAASIRQLAETVSQLCGLVAPNGHNHRELERKFDEVTGNFDALTNTLSAALAELQRQIQSLQFRRQIEDVFDAATGNTPADRLPLLNAARAKALAVASDLESSVTDTPVTFGRKARNAGVELDAVVNQVLDAAPEVAAVQQAANKLSESADTLKSHRADNYSDEVVLNRKKDRLNGGGGLISLLKPR